MIKNPVIIILARSYGSALVLTYRTQIKMNRARKIQSEKSLSEYDCK